VTASQQNRSASVHASFDLTGQTMGEENDGEGTLPFQAEDEIALQEEEEALSLAQLEEVAPPEEAEEEEVAPAVYHTGCAFQDEDSPDDMSCSSLEEIIGDLEFSWTTGSPPLHARDGAPMQEKAADASADGGALQPAFLRFDADLEDADTEPQVDGLEGVVAPFWEVDGPRGDEAEAVGDHLPAAWQGSAEPEEGVEEALRQQDATQGSQTEGPIVRDHHFPALDEESQEFKKDEASSASVPEANLARRPEPHRNGGWRTRGPFQGGCFGFVTSM